MFNDADDDVFVSYPGLSAHGITYTRMHLGRLMAKGEFPPHYQLSANRIAWKLSDLRAWKANRLTRAAARAASAAGAAA